ncbi:hypothetical protein KEM60_00877 [Austwickia sp. TVS 96-490-7B]|uniref:hypothetical protein n=1 Tax=Austwickia sp. TVS 96-490-7B TaxID=2830843 RepID=UPI001C5706D3|nr:hypothetical protein [Austwickia sp. TVS 96-490-7B]MBW3084688.1 hypothetical protein [Austwickia sp. TVS 96-490-7B]
MAANGYPHMVFVQPEAQLDKESLSSLLSSLFPEATVADKPLRLDLTIQDYTFHLWFEEAEEVAERYADFLPEGARRRWLSRCTTMIDVHGEADPQERHREAAEQVVAALVQRDGVEVFSEVTRRFIGMDYGDVTVAAPSTEVPVATDVTLTKEPAPAVAEATTSPASTAAAAPNNPEPEAGPGPGGGPDTVWMTVTPTLAEQEELVGATVAPAAPEDTAEPTVSTSQSTPEQAAAPAPEPTPTAPATPAVPAPSPSAAPAQADAPSDQEENQGFFRRLFGRR